MTRKKTPIPVTDEIEIERKFVLRNVPSVLLLPLSYKHIIIEQWYLPDKTRYRMETQSSAEGGSNCTYIKCVKTPVAPFMELPDDFKPSVYQELQSEVSKAEYEAATKKAVKHLTKWRMSFQDGEVKWDIDRYHRIALITAEVEMPTVDFKVTIPSYIQNQMIAEVSGISGFSNWSIAAPVRWNPEEGRFDRLEPGDE